MGLILRCRRQKVKGRGLLRVYKVAVLNVFLDDDIDRFGADIGKRKAGLDANNVQAFNLLGGDSKTGTHPIGAVCSLLVHAKTFNGIKLRALPPYYKPGGKVVPVNRPEPIRWQAERKKRA